MMKQTRETSHRSLTIEYSFYLQPMGLSLFPGSAIEAALPSGMGSKWVRFNGNVLTIKNKMASLSSIFSVGTGYNAGGIGLSRGARKCARPYALARAARQERGIQTKQGDWEAQIGC